MVCEAHMAATEIVATECVVESLPAVTALMHMAMADGLDAYLLTAS